MLIPESPPENDASRPPLPERRARLSEWRPARKQSVRVLGLELRPRFFVAVAGLFCVVLIGFFVAFITNALVESLPSPPPAPPRAPPSPPRPPPHANNFIVVDGDPVTNSNAEGVIQACGEGDLGRPVELCVDSSNASSPWAGVRCCSDEAWMRPRSSCCASYACSTPPCDCAMSGAGFVSCMKVATGEEAAARCAFLDMRLCTRQELLDRRAAGSGCDPAERSPNPKPQS